MDDIEYLKTRFNVQRIIPDQCPAGQYQIRLMQDKGWDIHPMSFRSDKVAKYGAFRAKLNKGKIQSYEDPDLRCEMLALENSSTSRQSVIIAPPGYSDDMIDSFVMSSYFYIDEEDKGFKFFSLYD